MTSSGPAGPDSPEAAAPKPSNADALAAVAEAALAGGPAELPGPERQQLVVHFDAGDGHATVANGPSIAPGMLKRLGCDSALVGVVEKDGTPLSIGRKTRSVPSAIRRALSLRDQGCRFPGCERKRFVDAHHIQHWMNGGETSLENLVLLCRHHHRLVHEGGFSLRRSSAGDLVIRTPKGRILRNAEEGRVVIAGGLAETNRRAGLRIEPDRCLVGSGESVDAGLAVDALLAAAGPDPP